MFVTVVFLNVSDRDDGDEFIMFFLKHTMITPFISFDLSISKCVKTYMATLFAQQSQCM